MSTRAPFVVLFALLAPIATGCVTKTDHDALQRRLDETEFALRAEQEAERQAYEEQLDLRERSIRELERQTQQYEQEIASLETAIAAKKAELDSLNERMAKTERELAEVLETRANLKASIAQMSEALEELRTRQSAADRRVAEFQALLGRFRALIDAGKLTVSIIDGRMVLTLPMDILFASGKADLTEPGRRAILEVGDVLATVSGREFQVEGHTDNVPIKTERFASNWELGAERSLVVLRTLIEGGVPAQQLSAATYGERRPAQSNDSASGRAANRRIEIVVVPDLSALPGYDELNRLGGAR